jgi:HK97 family phage portal protein
MKQVSVIGSGFGTTKAINIDVFFDYLESSKGVAETRTHFSVVPWVFRATNMRASAISRIPYTVLNSKGEEVEEWTIPLKQLLYTIEADLCLAGGAFVLKSETLRLLKGLQRLNPWTIKIETDSVKGITSFAQDLGSEEKKIWTPEQMIFFDHFYNPSDDLGLGVSPAEVSRLPANLVNNINNFANNYFENGAIPAVVLETEHQVKKEQQDETRKMWNRRLQGVKNAWNTIVLQRGLKAHVIGHATKDLAMPELEDSAKKQIAIAFGVPLGILEQEDVSHSTAESHQVTFWTDTIIPEADLIAEKLNESLFSNYDYTFSFRFQELEAIQNIEFKKAQSLSTLLREANNGFLNDILSQEEARTVFRVGFARLGFDEFAQLVEESPPPEIVEEEEPTNPAEQSEKVGDRDQDSKKALGSAPKPVYRELARWRKTENPLFKSEIIPEWYCNTIKSIIDWIGFDNTFLFLKQADARLIYEQRLREVIEPWLRQYEAILKSSIGDSQFLLANDPTQLSGLGLEARIFAEEEFIKHVAKLQTNLQPEVEVIIGNQVLGTSGEIGVAFDPSFVANQAARAARTMTTKLVKLINGSTQQAVLNATATVLETPGMGLKDLFRILTPAFGAYRAELIAVTETTRALSQGVMMVQDELAEAGIPMRRVWTTANDELVCPICGVLNGVPEIDFQGEYPDGSPAHPNCRCEIVLSSMSDQYHRGQATRLAKQREQMLQEIEQAKQR